MRADRGHAALTRRELLRLPLAGALAGVSAIVPRRALPAAQEAEPAPLAALPRVNGGLNVQPIRHFGLVADPVPLIGPDLVELQTRLLYELGFSAMRTTLTFESFGPNFLGAVPYVRGARALGIDVVGILADFRGFDLMRALVEPRARKRVVATYLEIFAAPVEPASPAVHRVGEFALQVLNEPTHFFGIAPGVYVGDFLAPVYRDVKELEPAQTVVAAAAVGNVDGVFRTREMVQAGLEAFCDRVAFHVYSDRLTGMLSGLVQRPVVVTESGAAGPEKHLPWVRDVFPRIAAGIGNVREIFYYDLFDLDANRWRVIDVRVDDSGAYRVIAESPALLDYWRARVEAAAAGGPHASFEDLVPDITHYFPHDGDLETVAAAQRELLA